MRILFPLRLAFTLCCALTAIACSATSTNRSLTCQSGLVACTNSCVNEQSDVKNCGDCGVVCATGQVCSAGTCSTSCAATLSICETNGTQTCAALSSDVANCGACGNVCGDNAFCQAGVCVTECTLTVCSGACVDVQTDPTHCGNCGTTCDIVHGESCAGGTCGCGLLTDCSGACIDTKHDSMNCGACGNACVSGKRCDGTGHCNDSCASGTVDCTGACVIVATDVNNCGACGNACDPGQICADGNCTCPTNEPDSCNGHTANALCTSLQTDSANCGTCGNACNSGETCQTGACVENCAADYTACSNSYCANLHTDANNCGACGNVCAFGLECCGGVCIDEKTNLDNCGACGAACAVGLFCQSASCTSGYAYLGNAPALGWGCLPMIYDDLHNFNTTGSTSNVTQHGSYALGQLIDGQKGSGWLPDDLGNGADYEWVGWYSSQFPTIVFQYPASRTFQSVTLGLINDCGPASLGCGGGFVCEPTQVQVGFSTDGVTFTNWQTFQTSDGTLPPINNEARGDVTLDLGGNSGTFVKIVITNANATGIDEISFSSTCFGGPCVGASVCPSTKPTGCGAGSTGTCANLQTDINNCGACGTICSSGQLCNAGSCVSACSGAQTACPTMSATYCADLQDDTNNCGACGNVCGNGQSCCAGTCVNLQVDATNCGACGTTCVSGQFCAGTCTSGYAYLGNAPALGWGCLPTIYDDLHNFNTTGATSDATQHDSYALGQLTDGQKGSGWLPDDLGNGADYEWVGWSAGQFPTIVFQYPTSKTFQSVTIGLINDCGPASLGCGGGYICEPAQVQVGFSTDGVTFTNWQTFQTADGSLPALGSQARGDLTLNLGGNSGTFVEIAITNSNATAIDEISFVTN